MLYERCDLPSVTLGVSSLLTPDHETEGSTPSVCETTFIQTVIGDVVAHLKLQKCTVLSDL